jgi:hypothetical protein
VICGACNASRIYELAIGRADAFIKGDWLRSLLNGVRKVDRAGVLERPNRGVTDLLAGVLFTDGFNKRFATTDAA